MFSKKRVLQVGYLAFLSLLVQSTGLVKAAAAETQPAWCELCTSIQCDQGHAGQLLDACNSLCDGTGIEFQCIGGSSCTGQGGGTYPNRLRCLRNL